jgi:quercetin dioxygenase-like cupin family protein
MKLPKEVINMGGLTLSFLFDGDDTDGQMVMFELTIVPGAKVPVPHYHLEVDEAVYGMEGELTSIVDGQTITTSPGESLFIPRGAVHWHNNSGSILVKVLCVLSPAGIGPAYFREIAALIKPGTPPDPVKATEIMLRHGLIPQKMG